MTTHTVEGKDFALETCPACGTQFLIPLDLRDAALRLRDNFEKGDRKFFCPEGHELYFKRPSEDTRMASSRAEIERLAERVVDLENKLAASEALVRQLGGNVTPLPLKGVVR